MDKEYKQPGFYPIPEWNICNHPNHMSPSHMVIPAGMFYQHICPGCGASQRIFSSDIYCKQGYSTS